MTQTEDPTNKEKAPVQPDDPYNQPGLHHHIQVSDFGGISRLVVVISIPSTLTGFDLIRKDRLHNGRSGGAVCIYLRSC